MATTIQRIVEDAVEEFRSPYWRAVLDVRPPPQAELIRVVSNCSNNRGQCSPFNPILSISSDGTLEFTTSSDNEPFINKLFIWITFQSFEAPTKYLFINAERTHTICIESQSSVIANELSSIRSAELSTQCKYYFQRPDMDLRDNSRLLPYRAPPQCSGCSLEYNSSGLLLGTNQFRYNIQHVEDIRTTT